MAKLIKYFTQGTFFNTQSRVLCVKMLNTRRAQFKAFENFN